MHHTTQNIGCCGLVDDVTSKILSNRNRPEAFSCVELLSQHGVQPAAKSSVWSTHGQSCLNDSQPVALWKADNRVVRRSRNSYPDKRVSRHLRFSSFITPMYVLCYVCCTSLRPALSSSHLLFKETRRLKFKCRRRFSKVCSGALRQMSDLTSNVTRGIICRSWIVSPHSIRWESCGERCCSRHCRGCSCFP